MAIDNEDMQSSFNRFRVLRPPPQRRTDTPDASESQERQQQQQQQQWPQKAPTFSSSGKRDEPMRQTIPSACQRCRRMKKKCTRPSMGSCSLCVAASLPCSIVDPSRNPVARERALKARIAWLSRYINDVLPSDSPSIESIDTGTAIALSTGTAARQASSPVTSGDAVSVNIPVPELTSAARECDAESNYEFGRNAGDEEMANAVSIETASIPRYVSESPEAPRTSRLPAEAAGRRFVDAYFRHVHRAYPFLDRDQVLQDVETIDLSLQASMDGIPTKLYVIMAIGCTTLQRAGEVCNDLSAKFKISYQQIIHECLSKHDIESVQVLVLLALYSLFNPTDLSPWAITGLITRQAISLGLTQNTSSTQGLSSQQTEFRNRLFWSIYVLDRMISVSYGLPFSISDDMISVPLPSITIQEYASNDRHYYAMTLQVSRHVISLRQLETKILQKIHFAPSQVTSELTRADKRAIVQDFQGQIENWYTQGCLLSSPVSTEQDHIPFHNTITWLNVRYQNLLVLLYSPSQFNSQYSVERLAELQNSAQKYVHSSAILFQQRQLPLNWVTLCRFLAMGAVLLYCFTRHIANRSNAGMYNKSRAVQSPQGAVAGHREPFEATAEVAFCANILEQFPERWQVARHSARLFRRFAEHASSKPSNSISSSTVSQMGTPTSQATQPLDPVVDTSQSSLTSWNDLRNGMLNQDQDAQTGTEPSFQTIRNEILTLIKEVLGETSIYTVAATADESATELVKDWADLQLFEFSSGAGVAAVGAQDYSRSNIANDVVDNGPEGFWPDIMNDLSLGIL